MVRPGSGSSPTITGPTGSRRSTSTTPVSTWQPPRRPPSATRPTRAWLTRVRHALLVVGPDPVLAALAALTAPTPAAREALRRERGYFRQHAERMAYHTL